MKRCISRCGFATLWTNKKLDDMYSRWVSELSNAEADRVMALLTGDAAGALLASHRIALAAKVLAEIANH